LGRTATFASTGVERPEADIRGTPEPAVFCTVLRYICVDQNTLRSQELADLVRDDTVQILLLDAAIMEMCKSTRWEPTVRRSLATVAAIRDRVHFVLGNGDLMKKERKVGRAICLDDLVDDEGQDALQGLLEEVRSGVRGPWFKWVERDREESMKRMAEGHLDHARNVAAIQELIPTVLKALSPNALKRLRRGDVGSEERIRIASGITSALFFGVMKDGGISEPTAKKLFQSKSYHARYLWLRVHIVIRWIQDGAFGTMSGERATNDLVDSYYVLVGSYCDQLLTKDGGPALADIELRAALATDFSWDIDVNYLTEERGCPS
jgi:hypothetical protein